MWRGSAAERPSSMRPRASPCVSLVVEPAKYFPIREARLRDRGHDSGRFVTFHLSHAAPCTLQMELVAVQLPTHAAEAQATPAAVRFGFAVPYAGHQCTARWCRQTRCKQWPESRAINPGAAKRPTNVEYTGRPQRNGRQFRNHRSVATLEQCRLSRKSAVRERREKTWNMGEGGAIRSR
jgi:hypothetical protein